MSQDIKELRVGQGESVKRIIYLAKEFLLKAECIDVVAGTSTAPYASRSCETLVRLNYVTYGNLRTETNIVNGKRKTRMVARINKTSQFQALYDENEANRKKKEAERQERQTATPSN